MVTIDSNQFFLRVTVICDNGTVDTDVHRIEVEASGPGGDPIPRELFETSSISDIQNESLGEAELSLYPNPVENILRLKLKSSATKDFKTIEIYDVSGRLTLSKNFISGELDSYEDLSVALLNPGIYTLILKGKGGFTARKFVKQ